ncbi:MAG TPA: hypothetical protein PKU94_02545 [Candidatus Hydrothermia bacterium]|nr:hypothetical protein [Candidatus Hydrothermae bacterium]HOP32242.1 hypothetical protein [Candidatus Hydrothermia bacterium]HRD22823.1 hypothetical protein [Candidatus Hydrothermia bacterium]
MSGLILSMLLLTQMAGGPDMPFRGYMGILKNDRVAAEIGLTPEQKKKIEDIDYNYSRKIVDLRAEVQKKNLELNHMISSDNFSKSELESLLYDIGKLEAQVKLNRILQVTEIKKVLTNEQVEKVRQYMRNEVKERHKRFKVENQPK